MFEFNGKQIKLELSYNATCEMEEIGVSMTDLEKKPLATIRAFIYVALKKLNRGITVQQAGEELETYFSNGGSIEELSNAIQKAVENSGFFPKNNK